MRTIFIILLVIVLAQTKTLNYTLSFTTLGEEQGWVYIGKVELQPTSAKFIFQTKSSGRGNSKVAKLSLQAVASADWQTERTAKCKNPISMPIVSFQSQLNGRKSAERPFSFGIQEKDTYYLVLKDCRGLTKNLYNNTDLKLTFTIRIFSNDIQIPDDVQQQL